MVTRLCRFDQGRAPLREGDNREFGHEEVDPVASM